MRDELFDGASRLIATITRGLKSRGGEGVDEVLNRLGEHDLTIGNFNMPEPTRLPALRHLPECLGQVMLLDPNLAAAIAEMEDSLNWRTSAGYSDADLGPGFMDNYGWCELVGSTGFFPGKDFRLGVLLLGPNRFYKDHYHPAPELYWPLTGPSDWKKGAGGFESRQAGDIIWHDPWKVHATITHDKPLLAVWSWTRDTEMPAKLVGQ